MNIYVVLVIQLLFASGTHIVAKAVTGKVDAIPLTFFRAVLSSSALMLLAYAREHLRDIDRGDWKRLLWLGFLGLPVNQFFYLYGIHHTTAANGALLYATTPAFVLVLSHYLLGEKITRTKLIGVALAFIGVTIVIFERGIDLSSKYTYGNLIILVAVVAWALYTIKGRPMILKYGALRTTSLSMTLGALMFFPLGLHSAISFSYHELTSSHWMGILYLAFGTSVIGYLLWYYALGKIETSKVAVFTNGQPIVATIMALIFLDYTITASFVIGGAIAVGGVMITQRG